MKTRIPCALVAALLTATAAPLAAQRRAKPAPVPELTKGDGIPEGYVHDWNLGAIGARGWMHSERLVTTRARQIQITALASDGPAAGILAVGDVLLGVDGKAFSGDARVAFGEALLRAHEHGEGLRLLRFREGQTEDVKIPLPQLGAYAETAPYACAKSARILEQGCAALAARMKQKGYRQNPIPRCLNALALLASGERAYLPLVAREAAWAARFSAESFQTWYYGYAMMLLAEYQLASGDARYSKGLRRLALASARGQSAVGSWGHRFAKPDGILAGYGMMNAPGIPLSIGLVLAREAGVQDEEVTRAIERSAKLLRFYAHKGAIPYGDHHPWTQTHEDNGKCGMGALLFALLGEADTAAFFARMALASHGAERDGGHTGNFFNMFWALPAIALHGERACGAWMREFGGRAFDFARRHDGSFAHQGPPDKKRDKYARWDASGAFLLAYALPRRALFLTGKRPSILPQLSSAEAEAILAEGRGWTNAERLAAFLELDDEALLARLDSWSPAVRERAAKALAIRRADCVAPLVDKLASGARDSRYGACAGLAELGPRAAAAVPALRAALEHEDLWLRVQAASALARIGKAAAPALPSLLTALARPSSDDDPRGMEQRYLCFALFDKRKGLLRHTLEDCDRGALMTAIRAGLQNQDGRARGAVASIYARLTLDELRPLLPAIAEAIRVQAPSGVMFAHGARMEGLRVLAKHRVREGIEACVRYLRDQKKHGSQKRTPQILSILARYGAHAQSQIEALEELARDFERGERNFPPKLSKKKAADIRAAIEKIRAARAKPALISIS